MVNCLKVVFDLCSGDEVVTHMVNVYTLVYIQTYTKNTNYPTPAIKGDFLKKIVFTCPN